jgi:hypothetical protein
VGASHLEGWGCGLARSCKNQINATRRLSDFAIFFKEFLLLRRARCDESLLQDFFCWKGQILQLPRKIFSQFSDAPVYVKNDAHKSC